MHFNMNKIFEIIIGIIFTLSGLAKFFDLQNTVYFIVSFSSLPVSIVKIFLAFLIISEVLIGFCFFMNYWKKKLIYNSTLALLTFFVLTNLYLIIIDYSNCGCYGTKIESSPLVSFIKNLLIIFYMLKEKIKDMVMQSA